MGEREEFMRLLSLVFVFVFVFSSYTYSAENRTILVLGDSLSAAYGFALENAWPSLLETRLQNSGKAIEIVNASISGDTTQGGLSRLESLLTDHEPAWLIIELGGNDGLRGIPPTVTKSNLKQMVALAEQYDALPLLMQIKLPPNYGKRFTEQFQQIFGEIAGSTEAALLPFLLNPVATDMSLMQADGLHPTVEAQPIIADYVYEHIRPMIR